MNAQSSARPTRSPSACNRLHAGGRRNRCKPSATCKTQQLRARGPTTCMHFMHSAVSPSSLELDEKSQSRGTRTELAFEDVSGRTNRQGLAKFDNPGHLV